MLQEGVIFHVFFLFVVIQKLTHNLLLFVFVEDLNFCQLLISQLHPWLVQDLGWCQSFVRIHLKHFFQHCESLRGDFSWSAPAALQVDNLILKLVHVGCFKRNCSVEHGIEHHTCTPNIGLETFVSFSLENFRSDVGWCSTLFGLSLVFVRDKLADSKVANFDVTFRSQKNVVKFDISVQDSLMVNILQSFDDLSEDEFGVILLQLSASSHIGQQITTTAHLHHVNDM